MTDHRPSSAQQIPQVTLIIRPVNEEWSMGEDWEILFPLGSTMYDLRVKIEEERGINRNRIMLRMKGKVLQPARDKWTLRRLGLYDGYVVQVEPTMSGSWWWYPLEHYIDKFIREIQDFLDRQPDEGIFLSDMVPLITVPPPIKQSLRTFIRMYPEHFHIYSDVRNNTMWVRRTKHILEFPTYERYPHYLGKTKQFVMQEFDWESYRDIDDKYVTEVFVSDEELQQMQAAKALAEQQELAEAERLARGDEIDDVKNVDGDETIFDENGDRRPSSGSPQPTKITDTDSSKNKSSTRADNDNPANNDRPQSPLINASTVGPSSTTPSSSTKIQAFFSSISGGSNKSIKT